MGNTIQITGVDEALKTRFRMLCAKEGKKSKEIFVALLDKYEESPKAT